MMLLVLSLFIGIAIIFEPNRWFVYVALILLYQICIFILFNGCFGFVLFRKGRLYVSGDFLFRVQKGFAIKIENIRAIEFVLEECNSEGDEIPFRYIGTPSYLKIFMNNGLEKRIHLIRYSFTMWKKIEKQINLAK